MMYSLPLTVLIALTPALAQVIDPGLVANLKAAALNEERIALLSDGQFVFNFLAGVGLTQGASGTNTMANAGNFPALIGNGIAMTVGFLEGCGMNTPHVHPRATEINFAVNGTLRTGMLNENGARFVANDVPAGSATIFPRGAIHFEMNTECEPTLFVAAFNDDDPGALAVAQRLFGLPPDIVGATLGDIGVEEVAGLEAKIPNNIAQGTDDCYKRCGITKVTQSTSQRQPRIPSNALPSGFSGPPSSPAPPPPAQSGKSANLKEGPHENLGGGGGGGGSNTLGAIDGIPQSLANDKDLRPFLIALLVINGLFVVGTLTALFLYVARKRGSRHAKQVDHKRLLQGSAGEKEHEYYDPYTGPAQ